MFDYYNTRKTRNVCCDKYQRTLYDFTARLHTAAATNDEFSLPSSRNSHEKLLFKTKSSYLSIHEYTLLYTCS